MWTIAKLLIDVTMMYSIKKFVIDNNSDFIRDVSLSIREVRVPKSFF
jgi:hypothetical protein